jgi:hypothetical protein
VRFAHLHNAVVLTALLGVAGCKHLGPGTILEDRIPYNVAIVESWKEQTLLNIVRLRYADVPEFVDVSSVVGGYEHSQSANAAFSAEIYPRDSLATFLSPSLGVSQATADRPTITYTPQSGPDFTRNLTTPIPPASILDLIESGNPADVVMQLAVESINGVRNRGFAGSLQQEDPAFLQAVQIIRKAQESGYVSLRVLPGADKINPDVVMAIRSKDIPESLVEELGQMRQLLRLDPGVQEFKIVFGMLPKDKNEIAFRTRSVLRILTYLALSVQVPEEHLAAGRAPAIDLPASSTPPQFTVLSSCTRPTACFTAVHYRGFWFWIDDRDFNSKRTMSYLKILLGLAESKQKEPGPALTIRAN